MENSKKINEIDVIYEIVEPARFVRDCIHCLGHSCWCITEIAYDGKETK